ncbi:MAG TPA: GNAT family N-acetyltransferase [Gemmatimonadales bacterium]|nr:GNAT family N-acetyltransferase [Gemmatimonadales bacterium]
MTTDVTAVHLTEHQIPDAAAALARAFMDDPLQTYTFPSAAERARMSPAHFEPLLRLGVRYGEVLTTPGEPMGAAVWLGPDSGEMTPERLAAAGLDRLSDFIGEAPAARFQHVLGFAEPFHARAITGPHWYLMVIGVDPAVKSQGVGTALIRPILARADAQGVPCYLETAQPGNVGYYRHLGFELLDEVVEPVSGLTLYTMRREPRPHA